MCLCPCMAVSFGQFRVIFLVRVSGHLCLLQPAAVMHRQGTFGWNLGAVASLHGKNDCRCLGKNGTYRIHKTTFVQIYIKTNLDHSSNSLLSMCFTKNTLHSPRSATYLQQKKKSHAQSKIVGQRIQHIYVHEVGYMQIRFREKRLPPSGENDYLSVPC